MVDLMISKVELELRVMDLEAELELRRRKDRSVAISHAGKVFQQLQQHDRQHLSRAAICFSVVDVCTRDLAPELTSQ